MSGTSCERFTGVLEGAGLPKGFRVYDLRHTFASLLLSSNIPCPMSVSGSATPSPRSRSSTMRAWIASGQVHRVNVFGYR